MSNAIFAIDMNCDVGDTPYATLVQGIPICTSCRLVTSIPSPGKTASYSLMAKQSDMISYLSHRSTGRTGTRLQKAAIWVMKPGWVPN
ncbi:MAG: hypothetical protein CM1200mP20_04290 [Pseudomonadota bacterium]|nr:MAG: hypothetical protein CM1200mP20_04290 [Pseudomonadota bacterium]